MNRRALPASRVRLGGRRLERRGRLGARLVAQPPSRWSGHGRGRGRSVEVKGIEVRGAERASLWGLLNEQVFDYESYQSKVSRQLAVVVLTPVDAVAGAA